MSTFDWRSRAGAAAIHLSGCAGVAALAGALVFLVWYPTPYDTLAGGQGLFVLITSVDVVMGPLITFAVFDRRRKPLSELKRDLAIVVLLQLGALGYGLHTMFIARPVVMALEGDRFRVVPAIDVMVDELPQAPASLRQLSLLGPVMLRTTLPKDPDAKFDAVAKALAGNDLGTRPKYWQPWDDVARTEMRTNAKPITELLRQEPRLRPAVEEVIRGTGLEAGQLRYLPVLSRHAEGLALVDARSGELIRFALLQRY